MGVAVVWRRPLGILSLLPLALGLYAIFVLVTGEPNSDFGPQASTALWVLLGLGWVLLEAVLLSRSGLAIQVPGDKGNGSEVSWLVQSPVLRQAEAAGV